MTSVALMVCLNWGLWWWYFELKGEARGQGHKDKRMFRRQLILTWAVTIITVAYLAYLFLGPGRYGEDSWL